MESNKTLINAIENRELSKVYSILYTILLSDPGFKTGRFDQAIADIKAGNFEEVFQEYNGTEFKSENEWDKQYWDSVASDLVDNFCYERIEHLKEVSAKLYINETEYDEKKKNPLQEADVSPSKKSQKSRLIIVIGAAVLIVLLLILIVTLIIK